MKDTGIGIKEEEIEKLFKLFGFLESSKLINTKGIGLGLHITKYVVNMFKGDLICQSKFGIGSNFIFIVELIDQYNFRPKTNYLRKFRIIIQSRKNTPNL